MGHVALVRGEIDINSVFKMVTRDDAGAVVIFTGTVRNHTKGLDGRGVVGLEMEAYDSMALKKLEALAGEVKEKFDIYDVVILHRVGYMETGEVIVCIGVSAEGREAAFKAAKYAIDRLKATVPLWKREVYPDGTSEWVKGDEIGK